MRLGAGAFTRKMITRSTVDQAVETFAKFRRLFDIHGVEASRAVATSALRNARNRAVLLHRVAAATGIELEVIAGVEEAWLVRKAVLRALEGGPNFSAVLDLGGGSLEISTRGKKRWENCSLPVGTVRIMESFGLMGAIPGQERQMVRRYVQTHVNSFPALRQSAPLQSVAICGGNPEAFAKILGRQKNGVSVLALEELKAFVASVAGKDVEERMAAYEIRRDRAEVLAIAGLVLCTVGKALGIKDFIVPRVGLRNALLQELGETLAADDSGIMPKASTLRAASRTFAKRMGHDTTHGDQVRRYASTLFHQLQELHGLAPEYGVVLEIAAILHDVGEVVNSRGHHRHGEYLLLWGRIPGLVSPYREMVAALVRAHRKSPPGRKSHLSFHTLSKERKHAVRQLTAILRLADGIDTGHRQTVRALKAVISRKKVKLTLIAESAQEDLPQLAVRKADLFESEFQMDVSCSVQGPSNV